jgi:hypothetical protein
VRESTTVVAGGSANGQDRSNFQTRCVGLQRARNGAHAQDPWSVSDQLPPAHNGQRPLMPSTVDVSVPSSSGVRGRVVAHSRRPPPRGRTARADHSGCGVGDVQNRRKVHSSERFVGRQAGSRPRRTR